MTELILPTDPVEIARPFATDVLISSVFETSEDDRAITDGINSLHYVPVFDVATINRLAA